MLKRSITYEDFFGNERTEEFYFNMTEAEVVEWITTNSDVTIDRVVERMSKKSDVKGIMDSIKDLIYRSYGEVSVDGRRFIKSKEVKDGFMETNAYSALFMELATDDGKAAEFLNSVIPKSLSARVKKIMDEHPDASVDELREIVEKEG